MAKSTRKKENRDLPDLRGKLPISIDLETEDRRITAEKGPGDVTREGKIVGVSVKSGKFHRYIPIAHPETENYPKEAVIDWLKVQMGDPNQQKVGANLLYDMGWLRTEGVEVRGPLFDVLVAEPLIDETKRRYNLDNLSEKWLPKEERKQSAELEAIVETFFGKKVKGKAAGYIHLLPASLVAPYALADTSSALLIAEKQKVQLEQDSLERVFNVESRLLPLLLDMRWKGVRVDFTKAEETSAMLGKKLKLIVKKLSKLNNGKEFNYNSSDDISKVFDQMGYTYGRTAKTKAPSFTKTFLGNHGSELAKLLIMARKYEKTISTFTEGQIQEYSHKGRIHCSFNQLRSDDFGTVTGRFSSSNPNLQQVPSKDSEIAELIRSLFIPDKGKKWWQADYSQIEYRVLVHFAAVMGLPGADLARDAYRTNPKTDFHSWVAEMIQRDRDYAKTINFGLAFGMGVDKLAASLGMEREEAEPILDGYHRDVPFVRGLSRKMMKLAQTRGYVKTMLGRRRRFNTYEPAGYSKVKVTPLPYEAALEEYGEPLQRAMAYKAMNAVVQGSAADMMKLAMVDTYEAGCYEYIGVPSLTVHDELDGDAPDDKRGREALREVRHIMENVLKLEVPVTTDFAVGDDWFHVKEI